MIFASPPTRGWTWGNNTLAICEYDTAGLITDIDVDSAGLETYDYDDAFRISVIADASEATLAQSYRYDLLDRLTAATATSLNQSWTYTYGYVGQNPIIRDDPTGEAWQSPLLFCARFPRICKEMGRCAANPAACRAKFCRAGNRLYHPLCDAPGCKGGAVCDHVF